MRESGAEAIPVAGEAVDPASAKGRPASARPQPPALALSVRELASAYLGGCSLTAMAGAGLVRELRGGALAEASAAFRGEVAPWLPRGC